MQQCVYIYTEYLYLLLFFSVLYLLFYHLSQIMFFFVLFCEKNINKKFKKKKKKNITANVLLLRCVCHILNAVLHFCIFHFVCNSWIFV